MCGREALLFKTKIEDAVMTVCKDCSKYGIVLSVVADPEQEARKRTVVEEVKPEIIEVVVSGYSNIIRKAREKLGLSQKDFAKKISEKESIVHKMETGHFAPSLKIAKKLEKMLNVKLIEETGEANESYSAPKKEESLTLGDVVKLKKK